jgi:hypothetical protein
MAPFERTWDYILYTGFHWWRTLRVTPPYARVSYVGLGYAQEPRFARSVGSACRLLLPLAQRGWALLLLPSRQLRLVPNNIIALRGPMQPANRRFFNAPNAG